jgi:DNA-binding transcriptional ArsR family regulator
MASGERVATVPDRMAAHWRSAMFPLLNLFLATHRILAEHDGMSPSVLLIYVTVCVGNIQKLMRERNVPADYTATAVLPRELVVPMSRSAIASATGLPRETVRRHIGLLIERGMLIEDPRGGVTIVPGVIQDRGYQPLLEQLLTEFARTGEALLRSGVIEVTSN